MLLDAPRVLLGSSGNARALLLSTPGSSWGVWEWRAGSQGWKYAGQFENRIGDWTLNHRIGRSRRRTSSRPFVRSGNRSWISDCTDASKSDGTAQSGRFPGRSLEDYEKQLLRFFLDTLRCLIGTGCRCYCDLPTQHNWAGVPGGDDLRLAARSWSQARNPREESHVWLCPLSVVETDG